MDINLVRFYSHEMKKNMAFIRRYTIDEGYKCIYYLL